MTAFGPMLNDEEVAGVLTYVRNAWGNEASPVKPETSEKNPRRDSGTDSGDVLQAGGAFERASDGGSGVIYF